MKTNDRSNMFTNIVTAISTIFGLSFGGFIGFSIGFIILFVLFADGTPIYFHFKKYFENPETVVILASTIFFAFTGGILSFILSRYFAQGRKLKK